MYWSDLHTFDKYLSCTIKGLFHFFILLKQKKYNRNYDYNPENYFCLSQIKQLNLQ